MIFETEQGQALFKSLMRAVLAVMTDEVEVEEHARADFLAGILDLDRDVFANEPEALSELKRALISAADVGFMAIELFQKKLARPRFRLIHTRSVE